MQERRAAERLRIDLNVRWQTLKREGRGAICDLSSMGCFLLTNAEVRPGELVRLEISFPEEVSLLWGQMVYAVAEIGFALRFVFAVENDKESLDKLIEKVSES